MKVLKVFFMMSSITTQFELKTQLVQGEKRTRNFMFIFGEETSQNLIRRPNEQFFFQHSEMDFFSILL